MYRLCSGATATYELYARARVCVAGYQFIHAAA